VSEHFYTCPTVIELRPDVNGALSFRDAETDQFDPRSTYDRVDPVPAQTDPWQSDRAAWVW